MPIRSKDARVLADYEAADGIGALAPRGWAMEVNHRISEASGRYGIAGAIALVFPAYRAPIISRQPGIGLIGLGLRAAGAWPSINIG